RLVPNIERWLDSPYQLLLPEKVAKLAVQLAQGGEVAGALQLARALLGLVDPASAGDDNADANGRLRPDPRPKFDLWQYEQILTQQVPAIVDAVGLPAFGVLCDALEEAVRFSFDEPGLGPEDSSFAWRPAIEPSDQNVDLGALESLMDAVRDSAERLVRSGAASIADLVASLEARPWRVFHRIALHLLRLFPKGAGNLIAARLGDESRFHEPGFRHEYALLARAQFRRLPAEHRRRILRWIERGPDREAL